MNLDWKTREQSGHQYLRIADSNYILKQGFIQTFIGKTRLLFSCYGLIKCARLSVSAALLRLTGARPQCVTLPVKGLMAARTQAGYIVYDLPRQSVFYLFYPMVRPEEFQAKAEMARFSSSLSFAPTLRKTCSKDQWFRFDYVAGEDGHVLLAETKREFAESVLSQILPLIRELVLKDPLVNMDASTYFASLQRETEAKADARWQKPPSVKRFLRQPWMSVVALDQISVAWTHGDFVHPNIIVSDAGVRIIDWNTLAKRSVYHDLHQYFFSQVFWQPKLRLDASDVYEAARTFSRLVFPETKHIVEADVLDGYRKIYYLERIAMLLGRHGGAGLLKHIEREIEMFTRFEQEQGYAGG